MYFIRIGANNSYICTKKFIFDDNTTKKVNNIYGTNTGSWDKLRVEKEFSYTIVNICRGFGKKRPSGRI